MLRVSLLLAFLFLLIVCRIASSHVHAQSPDTTVYVTQAPYNAVCDGHADDTVAITAAITALATNAQHAGTIVLPGRGCVVSQTLLLGLPTGTPTFLNLKGSDPINSALYWKGTGTGPLLHLSRNKYFTISDVGFVNQGNAAIGILMDGPPPDIGTNDNGGFFQHVSVSGFLDADISDSNNGTASEILYNHLQLTNAPVCMRMTEGQNYNHVFTMLALSGCTLGLDGHRSNLYVRGGSADHNQTDFWCAWQTCHISDFRSESDGKLLLAQVANIVLESVQAVGNPSDGVAIDAGGGIEFGNLTIRNSLIQGNLHLTGYAGAGSAGALDIVGSAIGNSTQGPVSYTPGDPRFTYMPIPTAWRHTASYAGQRYPDFTGTIQ